MSPSLMSKPFVPWQKVLDRSSESSNYRLTMRSIFDLSVLVVTFLTKYAMQVDIMALLPYSKSQTHENVRF